MSSFDNGNDAAGDSVDDLGRRAGSELRRPAPADGLANVQRSHRRRRTATAAGGLAVAAIAIGGGMLVVNRGGDDTDINISDSTIGSSVPATTVDPLPEATVTVQTSQPGTPTATTTDTTVDTVATIESAPTTELVIDTIETIPPIELTPTTETVVDTTEPVVDTTVPESESTATPPPEAESTWVSTEDEWPWFAWLTGGVNVWSGGTSSPPIADSAAVPLDPGAYAPSQMAITPSSVTVAVLPFITCDQGNLPPQHSCEDVSAIGPGDVGVAYDSGRTLEIALDERVTVHLSDFDCESGTPGGESWVGSGNDLGRLIVGADAAVEAAVLGPLREGADPVDLAESLRVDQPNGISDPQCPDYTDWLWTSPAGPSLIIELFLPDGIPVNPDLTPHRHQGWVTGLEVADDGTYHLYYFAGWTS